MYTTYSEDLGKKIYRDYNNGVRVMTIAIQLNVSLTTVYLWMKRYTAEKNEKYANYLKSRTEQHNDDVAKITTVEKTKISELEHIQQAIQKIHKLAVNDALAEIKKLESMKESELASIQQDKETIQKDYDNFVSFINKQ